MSITRLKNGSYRYRFQIKGEKISFNRPEKLSERNAYAIASRMLEDRKSVRPSSSEIVFKAASDYYLQTTDSSLSPSTRRVYRSYKRYIDDHYEWFAEKKVSEIDNPTLQRIINEYGSGKDEKSNSKNAKRTPKTVRNMYGFILSVIRLFDPDAQFRITIPGNQKTEPYIPDDEDVRKVLEYVKTTRGFQRYYVPLALASLGLRRSEICALDPEDLQGTRLVISKAKVKSPDGWVVKPATKTAASRREIVIPEQLAEMIEEQGCIYPGDPGMLSEVLEKIQDRLGMPHFSIHKLRHYYASSAIGLGIPTIFVARYGGWEKNSQVLQKIYAHTNDKDKISEMDRKVLEHMNGIL